MSRVGAEVPVLFYPLMFSEFPRTPLLGFSVNKGKKKGRGFTPRPVNRFRLLERAP
jgi:hypothetical protein